MACLGQCSESLIRLSGSIISAEAFIDCASLRLRRALGLTDAVIRYRDIDIEQSPPADCIQEYRAFHIVAPADPTDGSRTAGQLLGKQWLLAHPLNPDGPPRRIYWRDDFVPPATLFRAFGAPPSADTVMRAGIIDLVFKDITSDRAQTAVVLRRI
jgi:hypothetical protein